MNALLAVPLPVRLFLLTLVGLVLGSAANWAIYAWAWHSRPISPWQKPDPQAPPRVWLDYVPFAGWLGLARESAIHGGGFWVRPMLIELATAIGLPALYWWESNSYLAPHVFPPPVVVDASPEMLHWEFLAHAILIWLMLVATFIDFDEQTIPDAVTTPGTLIGLVLMALVPAAGLPVIRVVMVAPLTLGYGPLLLTSSSVWPAWLNQWWGLLLGAGIFTGWCVALIPATGTLRRGLSKAVQFYFASMLREWTWVPWLILAAIGCGGIAWIWRVGGTHWQSLLTALMGLAGGGLLTWGVRIVGWAGLRKEAMGFGDVTLMAMIGAYVGWQTCLVVFFLSPLAALFVAVTQWVLTRRHDIAFGPYLALTALGVIVHWHVIWNAVHFHFQAGLLIPAFTAAGLVMMLGLLMLWRNVREWLWPE